MEEEKCFFDSDFQSSQIIQSAVISHDLFVPLVISYSMCAKKLAEPLVWLRQEDSIDDRLDQY